MGEKNVIGNFLWRFAERAGAQLVGFIVSIVLARILSPEDFGTVTLITTFVIIIQVFVDSGFGNALIQKKEIDSLDYSTVFYFNVSICIILYIGMYFSAPLIADFYGDNELVSLIRVLSLVILISGVKNIQQAYVSRNLLFKKFFWATFGGTIVSAAIGIGLAYNGAGAWAIVYQNISNTLIDTIILWVTVRWRPQIAFSYERLKKMFNYGWKILVSSLLDTVYNNIRQLVIGKYYSADNLAYYNRGKQFPYVIISNINTSIDGVLLPTMSKVQDEKVKIKQLTKKSIRMSTFLVAPLLVGMAACADHIVHIVLTEKWSFCIPYMRIFCCCYVLWPIHTANLNAIKALGKSDIFLKLEIVKRFLGVLLMLFSMKISVMAMAYSLLMDNVISSWLNAYPNKKLIDYSYFEQVKDVSMILLNSVIMTGVCICINFLGLGHVITLLLQIVIGGSFYIILSKVLCKEELRYFVNYVKRGKRNE